MRRSGLTTEQTAELWEEPLENVRCLEAGWNVPLIPARSHLTPGHKLHFPSWYVPAMGCTKQTRLRFFPRLHTIVATAGSHIFFYSHIKTRAGCFCGCDSCCRLCLVKPRSDLYLLFFPFSPERFPVLLEITSSPGISFSS